MDSIRNKYKAIGVTKYYKIHGDEYVNPHFKKLKTTLPLFINKETLGRSLDLCCGSGEITKIFNCTEGLDPYTYKSYTRNTNKFCHALSFDDILNGKLNQKYDTILCSYALHLCDTSKLPIVIYQLSLITNKLIIISPHKKPKINEEWGFNLIENNYLNKIRVKTYRSTN